MAKGDLKHYELVVVFHPNLSEAALQDEIKKVETVVTTHGGRDLQVDNWGRREMTFSAKKQRMGTYLGFKFSSNESALVKEINTMLRITESALLFQCHRIQLPARKLKVNPKRKDRSDDSDEFAEAAF